MSRIIYLDKPRHAKILRSFLATQTHCKAHCVISTQTKLANKFGVSLATLKRDLAELERCGYLHKSHIQRPKGGFLCIYWVVTGIIFKVKSFFRKTHELLVSHRKQALQADNGCVEESGNQNTLNTNKDNTSGSQLSIDNQAIERLMLVANHLPVTLDHTQMSFLKLAARKFGVERTWIALMRAIQTGKYGAHEVVKVTWKILRQQPA